MVLSGIEGKPFKKAFPFDEWPLSRRKQIDHEIEQKLAKLSEEGLVAHGLEFIVEPGGKAWIVNTEFYAIVPPAEAAKLNQRFYSEFKESLLKPYHERCEQHAGWRQPVG